MGLPVGRVRGGVKARGSSTLSALLARRFRRWEAGDRAALWREACEDFARRKPAKEGDRAGEASAARRARRKAKEGQWSKACKCLGSAGMFPLSDEVIKRLGDLHPTGTPVPAPAHELPEALQVTDEEVLATL